MNLDSYKSLGSRNSLSKNRILRNNNLIPRAYHHSKRLGMGN